SDAWILCSRALSISLKSSRSLRNLCLWFFSAQTISPCQVAFWQYCTCTKKVPSSFLFSFINIPLSIFPNTAAVLEMPLFRFFLRGNLSHRRYIVIHLELRPVNQFPECPVDPFGNLATVFLIDSREHDQILTCI